MSDNPTGNVSISITAGHIAATSRPLHPLIGQQVRMSDDLYFHITPEVAAQWLPVIANIAKGENA